MNLNQFAHLTSSFASSEQMPVLFVGHGNPMNAITDNPYRRTWEALGQQLPVPKAILCVSAHWLTYGTAVTMTEQPETIHDFGGFPAELFAQQYPAPGAVDYARMTIEAITSTPVHEDYEWGLDHGAWSVLKPMFPEARIPVFQMSIDWGKPPRFHYDLAKELAVLRRKGVLIVGSGNMVHNLRMMRMQGAPYDFAQEFDAYVTKQINENQPENLIDLRSIQSLSALAHPSIDHYLPLLYAIGLRDEKDEVLYFNEAFDLGSVSMRSLILS